MCLPDGSSVQVPQATVRRSATLQEAIRTSDTDSNVSISLPRGVLQDWLQSVDALEAAANATGQGCCLLSVFCDLEHLPQHNGDHLQRNHLQHHNLGAMFMGRQGLGYW